MKRRVPQGSSLSNAISSPGLLKRSAMVAGPPSSPVQLGPRRDGDTRDERPNEVAALLGHLWRGADGLLPTCRDRRYIRRKSAKNRRVRAILETMNMQLCVTYGPPYARLARLVVIEKALEPRNRSGDAARHDAPDPRRRRRDGAQARAWRSHGWRLASWMRSISDLPSMKRMVPP